jgi:hypothetical protein
LQPVVVAGLGVGRDLHFEDTGHPAVALIGFLECIVAALLMPDCFIGASAPFTLAV